MDDKKIIAGDNISDKKWQIYLEVIGFIIISLAAISVFAYSRGYLNEYLKYFKAENPNPFQQGQNQQPAFVEPAEVFKIIGTISKIEKGVITLQAYETFRRVDLGNGQIGFATKIIKVKTDSKTQITSVKSGTQNLPDAERKTISLKDLKSGDMMEVSAKENIKDKAEFTAAKIEKLIQ